MKRKKVKPGEEFRFEDGSVAETAAQLAKRLKRMTDQEFGRYVNEAKHDFYTWLRDCLDTDLAEKVKDLKSRDRILAALK
jgi:hypothetical protein